MRRSMTSIRGMPSFSRHYSHALHRPAVLGRISMKFDCNKYTLTSLRYFQTLLTPYLKKLKFKTQKRLTSRYARNGTKESGQRSDSLRIHLAHGRCLDRQFEM